MGKWTFACGLIVALATAAAAQTTARPASQPAASGRYLVVKIAGVVGMDFRAEQFKAALDRARKLSAQVVVLDIETPGGAIADAEKIVDQIIQTDNVRFVAVVRKALSAGSPIAMSCKDIYVTSTATMGAAVSYLAGPDGLPVALPEDIKEKQQSAWRAICRKAAEHGEHPTILAEGMVDSNFAITMTREDGKVALQRDGKGEVLKARGRILTLTAKEAVNCELAKEVVPDIASLGAKLGLAKWVAVEPFVEGSVARGGAIAANTGAFYEKVVEKLDALGLASPTQTGLQRDEAVRQWDTWYKAEMARVGGSRVTWRLTLREAKPPTDPRSFELFALTPGAKPVVVLAKMDIAFKNAVAALPAQSPISLSGKLAGAQFLIREFVVNRDGQVSEEWTPIGRPDRPGYRMVMLLDEARIVEEPRVAQPTPPAAVTARPATSEPAQPVSSADKINGLMSLADSYRSIGKMDKARALYTQVIKDYPDSDESRLAAKQIAEIDKAAPKGD